MALPVEPRLDADQVVRVKLLLERFRAHYATTATTKAEAAIKVATVLETVGIVFQSTSFYRKHIGTNGNTYTGWSTPIVPVDTERQKWVDDLVGDAVKILDRAWKRQNPTLGPP